MFNNVYKNRRNLLLLMVLLLLSGCLPSFCVDPTDIDFKRVTFAVPARPDIIDNNYKNYWIDSGVTVDPGSLVSFVVKDANTINFCSDDGINEKVVQVDKNGNSNHDIFMHKGDVVQFFLKEYKNVSPSKKTCKDGSDAEMHYGNTEEALKKCNNARSSDLSVTSIIGNHNTNSDRNVWTRYTGNVEWLNGKLYNDDISIIELAQKPNCCQDPSSCPGILNNNVYALNYFCKRICQEGIDTNCFSTIVPIDSNNENSGYYFQGLKARIIDKNGESLQEFKTFGHIANEHKGIKNTYQYKADVDGRLQLYLYDNYQHLFKVVNNSTQNLDVEFEFVDTIKVFGKRKFAGDLSGDKHEGVGALSNRYFDWIHEPGNKRLSHVKIEVDGGINSGDRLCTFALRSEKKGSKREGKKIIRPNFKVNDSLYRLNDHEIPTTVTINPDLTCDKDYGRIGSTNGSGGYRVKVRRTCSDAAKFSLYYYVGDSAPPALPGHTNTKQITLSEDGSITTFNIRGSGNGGKVYFGVRDNGDGYDNNSGHYILQAQVPRESKDAISWLIRLIRDSILRVLYGDTESYNTSSVGIIGASVDGATSKHQYIKIIQALLVLYICIYSIVFMFGMIKNTQLELIIILCKIGVILALIEPNSWGFFKYYLFDIFINTTGELISIFTYPFNTNALDFHFLDQFLHRFLVAETWWLILSMLFAGPVGWILFLLIVWGIYTYFMAIFDAVCIYLVALISIALMLLLSPVFITFILFKYTRKFFDAWMKALVQSMLQPVFVFIGLLIVLEIAKGFVHDLFSYRACWDCLVQLEVANIEPFCILSFILPQPFFNLFSVVIPTITQNNQALDSGTPVGFFGVPVQMVTLFVFLFLGHLAKKLVHFTCQMAITIIASPGADLETAGQGVGQSLKSLAGVDAQSQQAAGQEQDDKKEGEGKARTSVSDKPGGDAPAEVEGGESEGSTSSTGA